jgi:hypothetical protein
MRFSKIWHSQPRSRKSCFAAASIWIFWLALDIYRDCGLRLTSTETLFAFYAGAAHIAIGSWRAQATNSRSAYLVASVWRGDNIACSAVGTRGRWS